MRVLKLCGLTLAAILTLITEQHKCAVQVRFQSQTWATRKQLGYTSTAAAYRRIAADEGVFGGLYRVRGLAW